MLEPITPDFVHLFVSQQQSSVHRFLQNRAGQFVVGSYGRSAYIAHSWAAVGLIAVGGIMLGLGANFGITGLQYGALGPLIAGLVNAGFGVFLRRKVQELPQQPLLTPEAKELLIDMLKQTRTGWTSGQSYSALFSRTPAPAPQPVNPLFTGETVAHQLGKHWGIIPKTAKDILGQELFDVVEAACQQYNRIDGILETSRGDTNFARVAQNSRTGADEAIFAIFHRVAMIQRYPETMQSSILDCRDKTRALRELADGLESLRSRPISIADRLGYASTLDSVLEDVRLERMAHEELSGTQDSAQVRDQS